MRHPATPEPIVNHPCPGGIPANYNENLVPSYLLPDILQSEDGQRITTVAEWERVRRPELLELFRKTVYGVPGPTVQLTALHQERGEAFGGLAVREQIRLVLAGKDQPGIDLLIYRPREAKAAAPVLLSLNFSGNHTTTLDPAVLIASASDHLATYERGRSASRWPFEEMLLKGYAVATFCHWDVAPDEPTLWRDRFVSAIFPERAGVPDEHETGTVAWWAWGLSRVLDYLVTRPDCFNAERVTVLGHSRQGKAALLAGAEDPRFALVISNNSGCSGAALARRRFGETVRHINSARPDWFCGAYKRYDDEEERLPVDQHQLIALIAPRPVYIASATEDLWADPLGEYLAAHHAAPAYELYGLESGLDGVCPAPDVQVGKSIGYHQRTGAHGITLSDWQHFIRFEQLHRGGN